jgi:hypothetical protein
LRGPDHLPEHGRETGRLVLVLVLDRLGLPAALALAAVGAAAGLLDRDGRAVGGSRWGTGDRDEQGGQRGDRDVFGRGAPNRELALPVAAHDQDQPDRGGQPEGEPRSAGQPGAGIGGEQVGEQGDERKRDQAAGDQR